MENLGQILPFWTVSFFVVLLLSIAIFPLTHGRFWESNRNKAIVSAVLSLPVVILFWHYNHFDPLIHEIKEYFSFIILLASLFIISGGIFLRGDIEATPEITRSSLPSGDHRQYFRDNRGCNAFDKACLKN